jgi:hypothetical protein
MSRFWFDFVDVQILGGMQYGEPLYICNDRTDPSCLIDAENLIHITNQVTAWAGYSDYYWGVLIGEGCAAHDNHRSGWVWPVRGQMQ